MRTKTYSIKSELLRAALTALIAVAVGVALPQFCHLAGGWLGIGSGLGEMLLPMHLPVMLAGMVAGPAVGALCGLASPLVSIWLTDMPGMALLPFMMIELTVYGACAGLLRRTSLPLVAQVIITQVAGRGVRAMALATAVYGFGYTGLPISIVWVSISAGAAGMVLQWVLLPLLVKRFDR